MKNYVFKLEPVLKLRKLKEENCRMELGQLIMHLGKLESQVVSDRSDIENYYKIQEGGLKQGISGNQIKAFPMLVEAKEKNIELLHRDIKVQKQLIEAKKNELAMLRGELKVMENLKEKDFLEYKKNYNKIQDQKVEEQTQIWLNYKNDKAGL